MVGILSDEADPAVSVMKVEHAPTESYADVGGLEQQVRIGSLHAGWARCACTHRELRRRGRPGAAGAGLMLIGLT